MDKENKMDLKNQKGKVHVVLAHSYIFYFLAFLLGLFVYFFFPFRFLKQSIASPAGCVLIILASLLIFWAQKTSRDLKKENISEKAFCQGPYCFSRIPTHWGLFLLILGFGVLINDIFIIIFVCISFIVTKLFYVKEEEMILEEKYGDPYKEYKKLVKF